jgi:hypothetical protein
MALHESVVHASLSLQLRGVPAVQVPLWQVSPPLQTLPSEHEVPFVTFVFTQPVDGLHESVVQTFESLQLSGVPLVQVPLWQVSAPLQTLPSLHDAPLTTGVCTQPVLGLHVSMVQTLESLQLSGVPAVQVPLWQVSLPLHTVLSAHAVPLGTAVNTHVPAGQVSVVHALLSLQSAGTVQVPCAWATLPAKPLAAARQAPRATRAIKAHNDLRAGITGASRKRLVVLRRSLQRPARAGAAAQAAPTRE